MSGKMADRRRDRNYTRTAEALGIPLGRYDVLERGTRPVVSEAMENAGRWLAADAIAYRARAAQRRARGRSR
jgi:hypothetical protein